MQPEPIAPETFLLRDAVSVSVDGVAVTVQLDSMLIRGAEPVLVDTGSSANGAGLLADLAALVDPADLRWLFVTHDDNDHAGNVLAVLEACPNARLVTSRQAMRRAAAGGRPWPQDRCRFLEEGEVLDAGDRALVALRPPLYDSPVTLGLLDTTTDVYWAADCFGALLPEPAVELDHLDTTTWRAGFEVFHQWTSPWVEAVDVTWWQRAVSRFAARPYAAIASSHGPVVRAHRLAEAIELLRELPAAPPRTTR